MAIMKWCLVGCSIGWITASLPLIMSERANSGTAFVGVCLIVWWITYALMIDASPKPSATGDEAQQGEG